MIHIEWRKFSIEGTTAGGRRECRKLIKQAGAAILEDRTLDDGWRIYYESQQPLTGEITEMLANQIRATGLPVAAEFTPVESIDPPHIQRHGGL